MIGSLNYPSIHMFYKNKKTGGQKSLLPPEIFQHGQIRLAADVEIYEEAKLIHARQVSNTSTHSLSCHLTHTHTHLLSLSLAHTHTLSYHLTHTHSRSLELSHLIIIIICTLSFFVIYNLDTEQHLFIFSFLFVCLFVLNM
jgi:hypothetical protein